MKLVKITDAIAVNPMHVVSLRQLPADTVAVQLTGATGQGESGSTVVRVKTTLEDMMSQINAALE